ncbi:MAG: hypothetical protein HYY37_04420 [Candidatus Aenigmarchaeota archaeon]|nr:hypothetical protein [Candidatus Aenigmarchaeota archaeon]
MQIKKLLLPGIAAGLVALMPSTAAMQRVDEVGHEYRHVSAQQRPVTPYRTAHASDTQHACRPLTEEETVAVVNYLNGSDRAYELYWDTQREALQQQGVRPQIYPSNIIGGFVKGDKLIFAVITPQDKSYRAELSVLDGDEVTYRSDGIYTQGAYGITQRDDCQTINMIHNAAGPVTETFEQQGDTYRHTGSYRRCSPSELQAAKSIEDCF